MGDTIRLMGLDYLEITMSEPIAFGHSRDITVTATDAHGDTVNTYTSCSIDIKFRFYGGIDFSTVQTLTMTDGVATGSFTIDEITDGGLGLAEMKVVTTTTDTAITGRANREYYPEGNEHVNIQNPVLVFTESPSSVIRDTGFNLTVQLQDGAGNLLSGVDDFTATITLVGSHASDVFVSPTPDAVTYDVTVVDGEWSISGEQITGGTGTSESVTITAEASGYEDGESGVFTVSDTLEYTEELFGGFKTTSYPGTGTSWSAARTASDAYPPSTSGGGAGGARYDGYSWGTQLLRGGRRVTGLSGTPTTITANWRKNEDLSKLPSEVLSVQVRYSTSQPTTGTDLRTAGSVAATITVEDGDAGVTGSTDVSAAISGTSDIYVWAVAVCDVNDAGYPPAGAPNTFNASVSILSLEAE